MARSKWDGPDTKWQPPEDCYTCVFWARMQSTGARGQGYCREKSVGKGFFNRAAFVMHNAVGEGCFRHEPIVDEEPGES